MEKLGISDQFFKHTKELEINELFEEQRKNIGKAARIANEIRDISKDGIASLKKGDADNVQNCLKGMQAAWEDLICLNLPTDLLWRHLAEAGQEMVEFIFVARLYPALKQAGEIPVLPSHQELMVTPQAWLAGICDAASELSKLTNNLLRDRALSKEGRIGLRERFLKIAEEVYDFVERFETTYAVVINNSRRKGYGSTYRGFVGRVERVIGFQQDALIQMFDQEAK